MFKLGDSVAVVSDMEGFEDSVASAKVLSITDTAVRVQYTCFQADDGTNLQEDVPISRIVTLPVKPRGYAPSVGERVLFGPFKDCWWLVEVLQQDGAGKFSVEYRDAIRHSAVLPSRLRPAPANMADQQPPVAPPSGAEQARDHYRLDPARSAAVCDRLRLRVKRNGRSSRVG